MERRKKQRRSFKENNKRLRKGEQFSVNFEQLVFFIKFHKVLYKILLSSGECGTV